MPIQTRSTHTVRVVTVATAIAAALLVWLIAGPVAGVEVAVRSGQGTQDIGAVHVVVVTAFAGLAGWALLATLERRAGDPIGVWTVVAVVVLLLSLVGPLGASTVGAALTLVALHLVTGVVLFVGFRRSAVSLPTGTTPH